MEIFREKCINCYRNICLQPAQLCACLWTNFHILHNQPTCCVLINSRQRSPTTKWNILTREVHPSHHDRRHFHHMVGGVHHDAGGHLIGVQAWVNLQQVGGRHLLHNHCWEHRRVVQLNTRDAKGGFRTESHTGKMCLEFTGDKQTIRNDISTPSWHSRYNVVFLTYFYGPCEIMGWMQFVLMWRQIAWRRTNVCGLAKSYRDWVTRKGPSVRLGFL